MDPRGGVKDYVRLPVFHLSSRPKWRELCCMEAALSSLFYPFRIDDTGEQLVACRGIFRQAHKKGL